MTIAITCQEVWQEISNYIDGTVEPALRARIEIHLCDCRPCRAVLEGARNFIALVGDPCCFQVPVGFSQRLYNRVQSEIEAEQRVQKPKPAK